MIAVSEAEKIIFESVKRFPPVNLPLENAFGMVLREDLIADRDLPPFDRVVMDGIGIKFDSWEKGNRIFFIEDTQRTGAPALVLSDVNACIEVMTGAVLPTGCDCVIPVENITVHDGKAELKEGFNLKRMQNVHSKASDCKQATALVEKGARLLASEVAVAASIGKAEVLVFGVPSIAVIATGDELVDVNEDVEPYQIRQSNAYAISAILKLNGYNNVKRFHIRDDKDELRQKLQEILKSFDVLILSGGVSKGKFDHVPEVLEELEVKVLFHKVKQCPGKPFLFGQSQEGQPVFALPGNPVSTQIGARRYILPYLSRASGVRASVSQYATLNKDVKLKNAFTCFLPVKMVDDKKCGRLLVEPVSLNGSGDFASLAKSDGFVELQEETFEFEKGMTVLFFRW